MSEDATPSASQPAAAEPGEPAGAAAPSPVGRPGWQHILVVAALATALAAGPLIVVRQASQNEAWRWLVPIIYIVALEAVITSQWLADPRRRHLDHTRYRLAELIVIALALRLITWALGDGLPGWAQWRQYLLAPLSFVDGLFFGSLVCALLAWDRAIVFSRQLRSLAVSRAEAYYYALPAGERRHRSYDRPMFRERPEIFRSLVASWLGGALLLALCAALSTFDIAAVQIATGFRNLTRLGLHGDMLIALLVYFLLGLWVISQARLDMMRARWLTAGVAPGEEVLRNWRRLSLTLLLVVAAIAALLPIGSTFAAAVILQAIFSALLFITQFIFLILNVLFALLLSLFMASDAAEEAQELPPTLQPTPVPEPQGAAFGETTALLFGAIFWLLVAAVAILALVSFVSSRGIDLRWQRLQNVWTRLQQAVQRLYLALARRTAGVRRSLGAQLRFNRPQGTAPRSPWRFVRINSLTPRERVRFFYLSTVRRAAEEGAPRESSETPSEYARDLRRQWPEAQAEIDRLTEAFIEARYSARDFEEEEAGRVKEVWRRVRRAIRRRLAP